MRTIIAVLQYTGFTVACVIAVGSYLFESALEDQTRETLMLGQAHVTLGVQSRFEVYAREAAYQFAYYPEQMDRLSAFPEILGMSQYQRFEGLEPRWRNSGKISRTDILSPVSSASGFSDYLDKNPIDFDILERDGLWISGLQLQDGTQVLRIGLPSGSKRKSGYTKMVVLEVDSGKFKSQVFGTHTTAALVSADGRALASSSSGGIAFLEDLQTHPLVRYAMAVPRESGQLDFRIRTGAELNYGAFSRVGPRGPFVISEKSERQTRSVLLAFTQTLTLVGGALWIFFGSCTAWILWRAATQQSRPFQISPGADAAIPHLELHHGDAEITTHLPVEPAEITTTSAEHPQIEIGDKPAA